MRARRRRNPLCARGLRAQAWLRLVDDAEHRLPRRASPAHRKTPARGAPPILGQAPWGLICSQGHDRVSGVPSAHRPRFMRRRLVRRRRCFKLSLEAPASHDQFISPDLSGSPDPVFSWAGCASPRKNLGLEAQGSGLAARFSELETVPVILSEARRGPQAGAGRAGSTCHGVARRAQPEGPPEAGSSHQPPL